MRAAPRLDGRVPLHKLEVLVLVVELGTVTRAAEQLFVAQPVVTAHLRSLEERFGVTLFVRQGRLLQLTEEGQRVHAWAAETLARGRAMIRELEGLSGGQSGAAVVGASMSVGSYILPPILIEFRRARPQAQLTLAVGDPETALHGVEQGEFDFCIVIRDRPPDGSVLEGELLGTEDIVLVTAPGGSPAADRIDIAEIAELEMIASPRGSLRRSLVDTALMQLDAPTYKPVIELGHPEAMKRAVMEGLGAGFSTRASVSNELQRGVLREVGLFGGQPTVPIYAVKRCDKHLSELQAQLLDEIRVSLQPQLTKDDSEVHPVP